MNKKLIALFLALLMASPLLASCGEDKPSSGSKETKPTTETGASGEFAEIDKYVNELAASSGSYNGKTFNILTRESEYPANDEVTGDLQQDALYNRNRKIEEVFDVKIDKLIVTGEGYPDGSTGYEMAEKLRLDTLSTTGDYDLCIGNISNGGSTMLTQGSIRPIDETTIFNFDKSWWLNDLQNQFSVGGRSYFLSGKLVTSHYMDASAVIFNKGVASQYNISADELYDTVKNGEWTIDKMNELASVVPTNGDIWRYYARQGLNLYMSGGNMVSNKDADDMPIIPSALTDDQMTFINKISGFLSDKTQNIFLDGKAIEEGPESKYTAEDAFADNKFLFWLDTMGKPIDLLEKEVEFGIIPMPKKDDTQTDYIAFSNGQNTTAAFIPKAVKDEEMTAYITEAMAALSEKYLEPAYYDKVLKGRASESPNERRMLDLIYSSKKYDLADIYKWGELTMTIGSSIVEGVDTLTSSYKATYRMALSELNNTISQIQKAE